MAYCGHSTHLTASPDGKRCIASTESGQQLAPWDVETGELVVVLVEYSHSSEMRHACFSFDSRWLATASDKEVVVRNASTGEKCTEYVVLIKRYHQISRTWLDQSQSQPSFPFTKKAFNRVEIC
jgi:WD40 repeat protein